MARNTFENRGWLPEQEASEVITRVQETSAIERLARPEPMTRETKRIARSAGVDVEYIPKGGAYGEDTSARDSILLTARKLGKAIRIAEEDIDDSPVLTIAGLQLDWATNYARMLDNATLGVTAAEGTAGVPFTSVYRALSQANAATGYAAGANILSVAGPTYGNVSDVFGRVEVGNYYSENDLVVIAHPTFKRILRELLDANGRPIFSEATAAAGQTVSTLMGAPVAWTNGAKTSATATPNPPPQAAAPGGTAGAAGNPLLVVANRSFLRLGRRSGPESVVIDGRSGLSALTDETILKMRARRGFGVAHEAAVAILEDTAA